jgi:hypothetical protein
MYYNCDPDGSSEYVRSKEKLPRDEYTPTVRNINLVDVTATDIAGTAIFIYGLPESKVEGVGVKDCEFVFSHDRALECPAMMDDFEPISGLGVFIKNAEGVVMTQNNFTGECVEICEF